MQAIPATFYSPLDFARFGNAGDRLYVTHAAYCVRSLRRALLVNGIDER